MLTVSVWLDESLLHFCFSLPFGISCKDGGPEPVLRDFKRAACWFTHIKPSHFSEMDLVTTGSSLIFCVWARASRFRCQHWHSLNGFRDVIPLIIILLLGWHLPELNRIHSGLQSAVVASAHVSISFSKVQTCKTLILHASRLKFVFLPKAVPKSPFETFETYSKHVWNILIIICSVSNFQVKLQKIHKIPK